MEKIKLKTNKSQTGDLKIRNYNESLINELEQYYSISGRSWNSICESIGINPSIISQWRKKEYPGKVTEVNELVERFLKIEIKKINSDKVDLDFVDINNSKRTIKICETAHIDGIMAVVIGDTGTGKTMSIRKYVSENDCIYIHANRTYKFPVEYLRKIHTHPRVGKDARGTLNQLCTDIINELTGKNVLIIIDQADYLNLSAIDIFRTINEDAKVGVVFVGLPSFLQKLRGNEPEVRQVRDRIKAKLELKPYSFEDAKIILEHNWPGLNGLSKVFYDYSNGSIRILSGLIYNARKLLNNPKNQDLQLEESLIADAAKLLERRNIF
ncbi:MAG: AAA family ATPase [Ignavibacteriaceae bacterium]|nr:AAA family ATPase [Ignavibacteriaceae bacterium]